MPASKWDEVKEKLLLVEGWARDGLTDEQIAHNLGIGVSTLYKYKNEHVELVEALKKGKEVVDREVENALLKRALGYTEEVYEDRLNKDGEVVRLVKQIHVQPDVTAQIFWLKNRKPAEWRDKTEVDNNVTINQKLEDFL